ncbi:MAG TPA: N-6 DNA methylase [Flexivirga sp.]|uniref:N-6 DNA methylase n=1 Tax=Flexivirga sp. TaxID=1962927 RepID=UPI002C6E1657|nr:N-6 DNA methylase [Flexivirga sp.]HWC22881.1 N-6 DNA methylase [Flexivirga sp.]
MTLTDSDTDLLRKARGAFFTPPEVAEYVTRWAVRDAADTVLEPSCGEAAFLLPAAERLRALGAVGRLGAQLTGADIHLASAQRAEALLAASGADVRVAVGDFLLAEPEPRYDAVIGNPPYVRYQDFSGAARAAAKRAALRAGVALTNLASSWAAFTVHSGLNVKTGGRLGLVLPAEILSVNYAAPIRDFLMREFSSVRLVLFTERVFPGVMEDVVLLMADGRGLGPTDHCELLHARNGAALVGLVEADVRRWRPQAGGRWSLALVDPEAGAAYADILTGDLFEPLQSWGDTTLGMVTGNNDFFTLTSAEVAARGLTQHDLLPLSPPGSRHLRRVLSLRGLDTLGRDGLATWLFRPAGEPSRAAWAYIREGEKRGVDEAYKCRVRSPWWRVPYQPPAHLLLTYMNADTPRLIGNPVAAHHLNSVHGVYFAQGRRAIGKDMLPLAALNSVTLLGAELVGRSYGGGVLKMEPREADTWPVPSMAHIRDCVPDLRQIRRRVRDLLAAGRLFDAIELVDTVVLGDIDDATLRTLRAGRLALHDRRIARSRSK